MKHFFSLPTLFKSVAGPGTLGLLLLSGQANALKVYQVGTRAGADYPTITAALADIPSSLTQAYELELLDATYAENVLLTKTGSAINTLTIRPATGVQTVLTGTFTFGAGSAHIILDGNNGTRTQALTLVQPSSSAPTLVFTNDASDNVVREVSVRGSNSVLTSGVVVVGTGTTTGNDRNTVTQCFVGNIVGAQQLPSNLVYAKGATSALNDAFKLTDSKLANFNYNGVLVDTGNGDSWTISGNSLYYDDAAVPTTAQTGIDFRPGSTGNGALISGNFIGGRVPGATDQALWENAGAQSFRGIAMSCGMSDTAPNKVLNNTVSYVRLTDVSSAALTALRADAGRSELTSNTVANVTNAGTRGVNSLVSQGTTILNNFTVNTGQLMVVESGLTQVLGDLTNNGILNHTGGDMFVAGRFVNAGTFAQTQGDIEIKGDMENSGQFTCSTGKVKLTGNGPQKVSGGLYFNLEVNGAGTKTFASDAQVFNGVQMMNGVLDTNGNILTLGSQASLLESNTSYVLGQVDVSRNPSTAGTAETFGGVGLVLTPAAGAALPGTTRVSRYTGTAAVGAGGRQGILRYFDITTAQKNGLNLAMTIEYFAHELNGISPANLRFFKSTDNGNTWQNKGISSLGTSSAMLNSVTGFSRWTLGDNTNPLPVGLTAFRAERQGRNALLTWATATEHNNRGFGLEVSLDGNAYRQIGYVAAEGASSTAARTYRFVDATEGKAGLRYYRLRQDDLDGRTQYFAPQQLHFGTEALALAAYPTRFGAEPLTVALTGPAAAPATLRLLDGMGREVWRQERALTPGAAPFAVLPACAPGTYLLTATVGGQVLRQRVVRE